jgi:hypothetical protein
LFLKKKKKESIKISIQKEVQHHLDTLLTVSAPIAQNWQAFRQGGERFDQQLALSQSYSF